MLGNCPSRATRELAESSRPTAAIRCALTKVLPTVEPQDATVPNESQAVSARLLGSGATAVFSHADAASLSREPDLSVAIGRTIGLQLEQVREQGAPRHRVDRRRHVGVHLRQQVVERRPLQRPQR